MSKTLFAAALVAIAASAAPAAAYEGSYSSSKPGYGSSADPRVERVEPRGRAQAVERYRESRGWRHHYYPRHDFGPRFGRRHFDDRFADGPPPRPRRWWNYY